jgi:hypothetical protein
VVSDALSFQVSLDMPGADDNEIDRMTRALRSELENLDVERATLANTGPAPKGTKAGDPVTLGAIALVVLPTLLPRLVTFLQNWMKRGDRKKNIRVRLEEDGKVVDIELDDTERSVEEILALAGRAATRRSSQSARPPG